MKKNKSVLIKEFFSDKPAYKQRQKLAYLLFVVMGLLVIAQISAGSFIVSQGPQTLNQDPSVILLVLLPIIFCVAGLAIYLLVISMMMERNARRFIAERIKTRFSDIQQRALAAWQLPSDTFTLLVSGYTLQEIANQKAGYLVDQQGSFYAINYQASVFIPLNNELLYYSEKTALDQPDSRHEQKAKIPIAQIKEISREFCSVQSSRQRGKALQTAYPYLKIQYQNGTLEASMAHYDHFDTNKNQYFEGTEQKLQELLVQSI